MKRYLFEKIIFRWKFILLLLVGISLRFVLLGQASLWFDEAATYLVASGDIRGIIDRLNIVENSPPLFYFIMHVVIRLNESVLFMRLFPFFMGALNVVLFYKVAKIFLGDKYMTAFGIGVFSPLWIHQSQDIRTYSLLLAMVLSSTIIMQKVLSQPNCNRKILFIIINTLGLYTHYYFLFFYISQLVIFCIVQRKNIKKHYYILLPALLFLPWLFQMMEKLKSSTLLLSFNPFSVLNIIRIFGEFITDSNFFTWNYIRIIIVIGFFTIIMVGIGLWHFFQNNERKKFIQLLVLIGVPFISMWIASFLLGKSIFQLRYFIIITPFVYIAIANFLHMPFNIKILIPKALINALLVFFCFIYFWQRISLDPHFYLYEKKIRNLHKHGEIIIHTEPWHYLPLRYYYAKDLNHYLLILYDKNFYDFLLHNNNSIQHFSIEKPDDLLLFSGSWIIIVDPLNKFEIEKVAKVKKEEFMQKWMIIKKKLPVE